MKSNNHKKSNRITQMYKHSFGHYYTERIAIERMNEVQERYPDKKLHVVREKRSNSKWNRYCVCEFIPFQGKNKDKKSQIKSKKKRA